MKLFAIAFTALTLIGFSSGCCPHEKEPENPFKHITPEEEKKILEPSKHLNELRSR